MAQTSDMLERLRVTSQHLELTFKLSPQVSSLTNDSFTLYRVADQESVSNPPENIQFSELSEPEYLVESPDFEAIQTHKHYNSISRKLTLFFVNPGNLTSGWYAIGISGVNQANGGSFAPEAIMFSYNQDTDSPPPEGTTPTSFTIEDHSIKRDAFLSSETISAANPDFHIVSTDPKNGEIFIEEDHNRGRISIIFSERPKLTYINSQYIKVQRKKISTSVTRWEKVTDVKLALDSQRPILYISLPSISDTPVYDTMGENYFKLGYKYRVRLSRDIES